MTYADNYNIRTTSVKFNDVADALDGLITRNYIGTTTGTSTAYLASASPAWTEYTTSSFLIVIFHTTNTAGSPSVTINVNNLGAKAIKRSGSDIAAGTIVAGVPAILAYTGVHFEILVVENALARDGTNSMTANLNFGTFLPTNVGAGTAALPAYCAGNDSDTGMFSPAANELGFSTNGVQRIEISSAGRIGINNNTPGFITDIQYTGTDAVTVSQFSADTSPCRLNLRKSRGATVGSNALVSAGDTAGQLIFWGNDGSTYQSAAAIQCDIATRTSGMPGHLRFLTTPDTSTTAIERVRITSAGNVGIGETAPAELLHLKSSAPRIRFEDTDGGSATIYSSISGNSTAGTLTLQADPGNAAASSTIDFQVDGTTYMSINSSGNVGIGVSPSYALHVFKTSGDVLIRSESGSLANNDTVAVDAVSPTRAAKIAVSKHSGITNPAGALWLDQEDGTRRYIWSNNSGILRISSTFSHIGTASNGTAVGDQTSDERLKDISTSPFPYGLNDILAIQPIAFTFKSDEAQTPQIGFSAQQVRQIISETVHDTNEPIPGEPEGAPTKLSMSYTSMIPVLVKAIQELAQRVQDLEA